MLDDSMPKFVFIDEDFTRGLAGAVTVPFALLFQVMGHPEFTNAIQAIMAWAHSQDHSALMSEYQRQSAAGCCWAEMATRLRKTRPSILPGELDALVQQYLAGHQNTRPVATLLEHLALVLSRGLAPTAIDVNQAGLVVHHRHQISRFGDLNALNAPKVFVVDATISEIIVRQCMPVHTFEDIGFPRKAVVYQCSDAICSTRSLVETQHAGQGDKQRAQERLMDVQSLIDELAATGAATLVVGPAAITGNPAKGKPPLLHAHPNLQLAHFGAIRGIDNWKDCEALVLVGRNEPRPDAVENIARALFFDDQQPIQRTGQWIPVEVGYDMVSGEHVGVAVAAHADLRVHEVLMQLREAESIQAIDRLRLIHNVEPKLVIVLSKLPLPGLKVDRLMTWAELTRGDEFERLYRRSGGLLPLCAKWIAQQTGRTLAAAKKAVERLVKRGHPLLRFSKWRMSLLNPPTLAKYRPAGQRSWSRFWHGHLSLSDAQASLENLLGAKVSVRKD